MLIHDAEAFCRFSSIIGQSLILLDLHSDPPWSGLIQSLGQLQRESQRMGMTGVDKVLERIKEHITGGDAVSAATVRPMIAELYNRMRDDLEGMLFLQVADAKADFYRQPSPLFGANVQAKFPSVIDEIAEAGMCYALDRPTASAFHSIRCLEAGIRALSRCLGIPDPTKGSDRSWAKMLNKIEKELDCRWPTSANRINGDGRFFEEAYAVLSAMQNPYRNATMHLDQKYTPDEARHIFEVVKGFMIKLSDRMDENGEPKA